MTGRQTPKQRLIAAGFGLTSLVVIGFTLKKYASGEPVGTSELTSIAAALAAMFGALTWGNKEDGESITQEEEMGRHITFVSAKAAYFIMLAASLIVCIVEKLAFGRDNMAVLILLGLGIVLLPAAEYIVARKYR
ncbi:hypothetical protein [Paenibacillus chitinolyticus]|uniref:hypothetical protein n=1 Tax=Paenibacillus chitinolyticus TaxID=79263 RepID=UPI003D070AF7